MPDLLICVDRQDFPAALSHGFFLPSSSPVVLCGPTDFLSLPRIAVLNSRQSPRLIRSAPWLQQTLIALHHFDPDKTALVSSLGTPSWDFLTWAGAKLGFPLLLVFPAGTAQNFNITRTKTVLNFDLDENRTLAIRPIRIGPKRTLEEDHAVRDRWILALSQRLTPISLRANGHLAEYLRHPELPRDALDARFQIPYIPPDPAKRPQIPRRISVPSDYHGDEFLIHWTRSCVGPWPGESHADYFTRLLEGEGEPLSGLETLERILEEGMIRASGRLVRGGYQVVPFTERPPEDLPKLTNWRSGLRRWTFEPYGIALNKARLIELGARPVIYGEIAEFEKMSPIDQPFFQIAKSGSGDWRVEKEWRLLGDVRLNHFSGNEMVALVRATAEAAQLETANCRVIALEK